MQAKSWILVRILLNRFHPKTMKNFLDLLPQEDAKQVVSRDVIVSEIDPVFVKPQEFLKNMHFSWIAPYVQKHPKHTQELIISALPNPLASTLKKYLKISSSRVPMAPRAGAFFVRKLYDEIHQPDILPPNFLPKENLSILLDLKRSELIDLIDFLGLYDLADEVRHIGTKKNCKRFMRVWIVKKCNFYGCVSIKKINLLLQS